MRDDDDQIGQLLSRREVLAMLGAGGSAMAAWGILSPDLAAVAAGQRGGTTPATGSADIPGCVVRPESTEGPYYVDRQLERSDIRMEPSSGAPRAGLPLGLTFNVSQIAGSGCAPLSGAVVDVWQCDAEGVYSGVSDDRFGFQTVGQKFLRGYQATDRTGVARFMTIYPGWYSGRPVHIHFKIRTTAPAGGQFEFTSQLYFDEAVTDRVHARTPYAAKGRRDTTNATDGIFRNGGDQLLLKVAEGSNGLAGAFDLGLDLTDAAVGRPDGFSLDGRGRPGGPGAGRGGRGRGPA